MDGLIYSFIPNSGTGWNNSTVWKLKINKSTGWNNSRGQSSADKINKSTVSNKSTGWIKSSIYLQHCFIISVLSIHILILL